MKAKNCKVSDPTKLKTRPDLGDQEWLVWLGCQPENRGLDPAALYRKMLEWCRQKGVVPTRKRLLRWLDTTREEIPVTYEPAYFKGDHVGGPDASDVSTRNVREGIQDERPDCEVCRNERFVTETVDPDAQYEWARTRQVPCPACSSGGTVSVPRTQ